MDIVDKLRWIDSISLSTPPTQTKLGGRDIEAHFPGQLQHTPVGSCFTTTFRQQLAVADVLARSSGLLHLVGKDESLQTLDLRCAAFVDCETTGLAGGSGTYCFLVGIGTLVQGDVVIKQFFLRNFSEEPALLHAVREELSGCQGLVTYNGKAYDYPLLLTRFALRRMPAPQPLLHLDLLHAARRLWRDRIEAMTLNAMETQLLGIRRAQDIPGHLIPSLYFAYLRSRDAAQMPLVFEHNRQDILSLMHLAARLLQLHAQPDAFARQGDDLFALGRVYEDLRLFQRSAALYELARAKGLDARASTPALLRLSLCYKRLGHWDRAIALWEEMAAQGAAGVFPYVELAKYYEHRARQYQRAMELVDRALHALEVEESCGARWHAEEQRAQLLHRRRRLLAKMRNASIGQNSPLEDSRR
ncbi:MAG: ribonuclease H-like domain-containing protein [bacterium]|jgi:uncharacterized protein YprB with RNaseH-like and TPR domain|nr:ribonuclease H-like domain-containing protein [candidate division KSB1 bacterium]MDH7560845.1 ribonuclease H-like domain-containing protein [bacterium]